MGVDLGSGVGVDHGVSSLGTDNILHREIKGRVSLRNEAPLELACEAESV